MAVLRNVYIAFFFTSLGGLLYGFLVGITGNVLTTGQLLCHDNFHGVVGTWTSIGYAQCYRLSSYARGGVSCAALVGACLSSLVCFRFADVIGRRRELQLGAGLDALGAAVAAASPTLWGVLAGLALYGLGVGFTAHAAPLYLAEIAPASIRGRLLSGSQAAAVLGTFAGFLVGALLSGVPTHGWRLMVLVAVILAGVMGAGITAMPQSPRYLVLRGARSGLLGMQDARVQEAGAALRFFRGASAAEVQDELESMYKDSLLLDLGSARVRWCDVLGYPRLLLIGCGLVVLQQTTGQPSVLYFTTNIFKDAGFRSSAARSSAGVAAVMCLATLFAAWRVDRFGRRGLLFGGISMMAVALLILAICFYFRVCDAPSISVPDCNESDIGLPRHWAVTTVAALTLYVSGYQISFGPITLLIISEIFPLPVRGSALSIAVLVNFASNICMTLHQEVLLDTLTPSGVFLAYMFMSILSMIFVWANVPETRGKTLEELQQELTGAKEDQPTSWPVPRSRSGPNSIAAQPS